MNKLEERLFAMRRLLKEKRQAAFDAQQTKRNPERMKRIMPARVWRRSLRDVR